MEKRIASFLKNFAEDLLFGSETFCVSCGQKLQAAREEPLCSFCSERLPMLPARHELTDEQESITGICYSAMFYDNFLKELFGRYKFGGEGFLLPVFVNRLEQAFLKIPDCRDIEWITYIPMHHRRETLRGYNPAEQMARALAGKQDLLLVHGLKKMRESAEQKKSSRLERERNVVGKWAWREDAFLEFPNCGTSAWRKIPCQAQDMAGTKGILLDDFLTTGSTIQEGFRVLEERKLSCIGLVLASAGYPSEEERSSYENSIGRTLGHS